MRATEKMTNVKVTYWDFAGGRGEEVRLALAIAGIEFEDNRINRETFTALKRDLPFAMVPVIEIEGHGMLGQTNAILRLVGRLHGLFPEEPFEAARHDVLMDAVEDLRWRITRTMTIQDGAEKKAAREQLSRDFVPDWGLWVERLIGDGPFVNGATPGVADIKIHMVNNWLSDGRIDDMPRDLLDAYPKLKAVASGVGAHPAVVAWYAK
jgi:glutathione S-transferase